MTVVKLCGRGIIAAFFLLAAMDQTFSQANIQLSLLGSYDGGNYERAAAEIVAHDPRSQRLFVVNAETSSVDVLDVSTGVPTTLLFSISMTPYGRQANSVDIYRGLVAVAVEAVTKTDPGKIVFFDTNGDYLADAPVGAVPDMLTFTPNGRYVLVANEAEPNDAYTIDPEGSVSIVEVRRSDDDDDDDEDRNGGSGGLSLRVRTATFTRFNNASLDSSIRIFGPGASVAEDLEPEYIATSRDGRTAYVTLQENNAIGILDVERARFTRLVGLGFKNHNAAGNGFSATNSPAAGATPASEIRNWPVSGMYQPDGIASFTVRGRTYLITANEGDVRAYTGFNEEIEVKNPLYQLDPLVFQNSATLKLAVNLGNLKVTKATGNLDGDPEFERIHSFGARSFSIRDTSGSLVFDSGDDLEQITASALPLYFNASNSNNTRFNRSDDKGPEPEGVTTGDICGRTFAFIVLERIGGVVVYDVTTPANPRFVQYVNNRNFLATTNTSAAGDLGPEGVLFIPRNESPTATPLLAIANEISGTTTTYSINVSGCNPDDDDDDDERLGK